jgi:glycine/D-amino acid oxidase-like deaminating enzyme
VAIVGAGISGVATLYSLLTSTQKKVVLLEKNTVASGATGHNAGLAIVFMEKPVSEVEALIGKEATQAIYSDLDKAWDDLHTIHEEIGLKDNLVPFSQAANGFNSIPRFVTFLEDLMFRSDYMKTQWRYLVSENIKDDFPEELLSLVEFVPHQTILTALKTIDTSYIAATVWSSSFKGKRMNSAKFCCKVLDYLNEKFGRRFSVYEETDITKIDLFKNHSVLQHAHGKVTAQEVILCTNAYKDFSIWDRMNEKPYTKLQDSITSRIGFLVAYPNSSPQSFAMGFVNHHKAFKEVPFWYFSHAPYPTHDRNHSCVLGGPEFNLDGAYSPEWVEAKGALSLDLIQYFLKMTFKEAPATLPFFWHGWMGYTSNGLRWVGPDSDYPHLWYNLACNGIGIVPAIAGAKKIAALMA